MRWCGRVDECGGVNERTSEVVWTSGRVWWCGREDE